MEYNEALELIEAIRSGRFESELVEVKASHRALPSRIYEALSAFANHDEGGIIVLGLDERRGFAPVGVFDPQAATAQLMDIARRMDPALSPSTIVVYVEDAPVIVVDVAECLYDQKPCFYKQAGLNAGSYIRVGNTNRQMTSYEVFSFVSNRGQPKFDQELVAEASLDDLDHELLRRYLDRVRQSHTSRWDRLRLDSRSYEQQLCALDIAHQSDMQIHPTLAGLLCFGIWPQRLFPSLVMTFVRYPGTTVDEKGPRGERFIDNLKCEGSLVEMVDRMLSRITDNMRQSVLIEGLFNRRLPEYPTEAIREALVNAVVHRDYSHMVRGSQIRIEMYADRIQIQSPGGLYGPVNEHNLEEAQSTRNQLLMRFLEDLGAVENRGSGIRAMVAAMREARLEPPRFRDTRDDFRVVLRNASLMNPETIQWLNQFGDYPLNDSQRRALVYLRHNDRMTNSDYRRLNNVSDTTQATRELRELVDRDLVVMHSTRRWATYALSPTLGKVHPEPAIGEEELAVLQYVRQYGSIARSECADLLGCSPEHATYVLQRMRSSNLIRIQEPGKRRWTRYVIP